MLSTLLVIVDASSSCDQESWFTGYDSAAGVTLIDMDLCESCGKVAVGGYYQPTSSNLKTGFVMVKDISTGSIELKLSNVSGMSTIHAY